MAKKLVPLEWYTEKRKLKELIPFEKNPRKLTREQREHLKKSLTKFNLVEIPALDLDNTILAGHKRIEIYILIESPEKEIDVRVPNRKLTDKEREEYNLRSNKNVGEWVPPMLAEFGEEMLEDVGFSAKEIEEAFSGSMEPDDPEHEFTEELQESHNYIVLYFDNDIDWQTAQEVFGLEQKKALQEFKKGTRVGIGRVVNGAAILGRIKDE